MARDRIMRRLVRERFVVTLKSGETFDGLLDALDDRTLELVDANAHDGTGKVSVDGRLYIVRADVAYMQRPEVIR